MRTGVELFFCWGLALYLVYLSYALLKRNRQTWMVLFPALGAFVLVLCSFAWFQGVFKTHIISVVTRTLKAYGEKLDEFQSTTGQMQTDLESQQSTVKDQQKEIEEQQKTSKQAQEDLGNQQERIAEQFEQLAALQKEVSSAQTNLAAQQKQLEDVEYYVRNVFSKTTLEHISSRDTNKVTSITKTNGNALVLIKLQHVPIENSITCSTIGPFGRSPVLLQKIHKNLALGTWVPGWGQNLKEDMESIFTIQYVIDSRATNFVQSIGASSNFFIIDGSPQVPPPVIQKEKPSPKP